MARKAVQSPDALAVDACAHTLEVAPGPVDLPRALRTEVMLESVAQAHRLRIPCISCAQARRTARNRLYPRRRRHRHFRLQPRARGGRSRLELAPYLF